MESHGEIIIAFELYGTLLSIESVARKLADHILEKAQAIALTATWRKYQLEYISRLNSMGNFYTHGFLLSRLPPAQYSWM